MRHIARTLGFFTLFVTVAFLFAHYVYQAKRLKSSLVDQKEQFDILKQQQQASTVVRTSPNEKFMSFFPHGDFATQHEAVRNALRIALETNRTLILPQVRLGKKDIPWAPFTVLEKYYTSQNKQLLKRMCARDKKDWRLEYQSCEDINQWIELPWSTFFDLKPLKSQFGIRVRERKVGHGWGKNEPLLSHLGLTHEDVIVVDPNSFPSNGSDWDTSEQHQQKVVSNSLFSLLGKSKSVSQVEEEESLKLKLPLKLKVTSEMLKGLDQRYIQFGSLVYGLRFQTSTSKKQAALQKALRSNVFTSPNQFRATNLAAQKIVAKMGGPRIYNVIHMNLETVTKTELDNQRSMMKENAEIDGVKYENHLQERHPDGTPYTPQELLNQLDHATQTDMMASLVRELMGDMPIHQAISAAMPFQQSDLKGMLEGTSSSTSRAALLSACIRYRKTIDTRYPIYYLTNDMYEKINDHPELFGPLLEAFPCAFTPEDMYNWGYVKRNWASRSDILKDPDVDYEALLSPIMEILIARKAYSFFEVPTTKLTRLLSWQ